MVGVFDGNGLLGVQVLGVVGVFDVPNGLFGVVGTFGVGIKLFGESVLATKRLGEFGVFEVGNGLLGDSLFLTTEFGLLPRRTVTNGVLKFNDDTF